MVNALVHDALVGAGTAVTRIDIAGPRLAHSRGLGYHAKRIARNVSAVMEATGVASSDTTLYIVPDAGLGSWYTLVHIVGLAGRFGRVVIHHHSCRYIEEYSWPIAAIVRRTSNKATHVFLTPGMGEAFARTYGKIDFHIATNARFVAEETRRSFEAFPRCALRIGHLSNLCADKGFFVVADTFDALCASGRDVELVLAGPMLEAGVEDRLASLKAAYGNRVTYLGPLAGEAKRDFYRGLDLFLFPSRFRQEAAPLVVYEAMSAGVPVLATDRGVIAETIPKGAGAICGRNDDFTAFTLATVASWDWHQDAVQARGQAIKAMMEKAVAQSITEFDRLATLLTDTKSDALEVASL